MPRAACHPFASAVFSDPFELPRTSKSTFDPPKLGEDLTVLRGVGQATAREAQKLGLSSLRDLLFCFPYRHEDFTAKKQISDLKWNEEATVSVKVKGPPSLQRTRRRNLRLVKAMVGDESGYMTALWFNQDYLAELLKQGDELFLRGAYDGPSNTFRVRTHELLGESGAGLHTTGFVPVYHTSAKISVKRLRGWLAAIKGLAAELADPLSEKILFELALPRRADAILAMHFPHRFEDFALAQRRMIFEELYLMQVGLLSYKKAFGKTHQGIKLGPVGNKTKAFIKALPFRLTDGQKQACREISADLQTAVPMRRLLQGDVGAGKTIVAVYTMLRAVEYGAQAALMAPTEVLAQQHYLKLKQLLAGLDLNIAFISSRLKAKERQQLLDDLGSGEIDIAVGTHALIQKGVAFHRLAVVVVDEQHRFGVRQRDELTAKATHAGATPHVLHMTATPIPRTLALTLYGDLDLSIIPELPAGRPPITTRLVPEEKRADAYRLVREHLDAGRQCYVVCPLIEESDALEAKAVESEAARLARSDLTGYRMAVLHGQMRAEDRQEVMARFAAGAVQVLVTTTIIEVGIDVQNATIMVIEEADRFGLAQLHQLRGRVGRGGHKSYCLLFGDPGTEQARLRLQAIAENADGFRLADLDLEIRGEGQILGARQSGLPDLRLARLTRDQEILQVARAKARDLVESDPLLSDSRNALVLREVGKFFGSSLEWLRRI
jgi:ATP-dependent DNA helicase RecG